MLILNTRDAAIALQKEWRDLMEWMTEHHITDLDEIEALIDLLIAKHDKPKGSK